MLDWDLMRVVLAVGREGGLSGAARELSVNHATVSRHVARAEEQAGMALFDRLPGGLVPTRSGLVMIQYAERMESEMLALHAQLLAGRADAQDLAITIPPLLANDHFAQDIVALRGLHPQIELTILGDNRVFNLHRREADIAIRVSPDPPESLWGRVIAQQTAHWYASQPFLTRYKHALAGQVEDALPYIAFTSWKADPPKALRARFPRLHRAVLSDDMPAMLSMMRAGMGLSRLPRFVGSADPDLVDVPGLAPEPYHPVWILTHPDLKRQPLVRSVMSFLAHRFHARAQSFATD